MNASGNKPRIGFLGLGWIGINRMEALVKSRSIIAVAAADPSPEACHAAGSITPGLLFVDCLDSLLGLDLDGIVIATPSAMHAKQAKTALSAGKAVFCQKPLAGTAAEVRSIVNAARGGDLLLGVDLSYRHLSGSQKIRDLLQAGKIGEIYAVSATFHNAYGPDKSWFYDRTLSGGGCMIDLGIHLVDLVLWMLGFPPAANICSKLFARGVPVSGSSSKVEDYAFVHADLGGGTHCSIDCSWRLPAGCDAVIQASFYGSEGGVSLRNINGSFYDFIAERYRGTSRELLQAAPDDWSGRAAVAWARQLMENGNRYNPENEQLIAVSEFIDTVYR